MHTYDFQTQIKIQHLLQWSEDEYNELVFNEGIGYLKELIPDYPQVFSQIAKSKIFWNWWRLHWQKRDEQFLEECETWQTTLEKHRLVYCNHNDGRTLANALYLNGQVLQDSYATLMQQLLKSQTKIA